MNHKAFHQFFIALLAGYLLLHTAQHYGIGPAWIRFYAKDFILVPILLSGCILIGHEIKKPLRVSKTLLVITVIYTAVVFEWILPQIKPQLSADPLDIVMYSAGAFGFKIAYPKLFHNQSLKFSREGNLSNHVKT